MRKWIFASILMIVLIALVAAYSPQPQDIPGIGDDSIAFIIQDNYSYDIPYSGPECQWDFEIRDPYIINPSPQSCQLEVTNLETKKVYTVRHRIILSGSRYHIKRLLLSDSSVLSEHNLTINR